MFIKNIHINLQKVNIIFDYIQSTFFHLITLFFKF